MKSFCILEQGRSVGDPDTARKKALFSTEFSDFYRLNWEAEDDPDAAITRPGIVWSEGRALLYERVPKIYDYYVFTDDDISFSPSGDELPLRLEELLERYRPLSATFLDVQRFSDPEKFNFLGTLDLEACLAREAFPIGGYDQQVQVFSSSYARVMFPPPYHGAGMSMWYSQWICSRQYPCKQVCFTGIQVRNTRAEPHDNEKRPQHSTGTLLVALFAADVKGQSFRWHLAEIQEDNREAFELMADREPVEYTLSDLAELYDVENPRFRGRRSAVSDPASYIETLSGVALPIDPDSLTKLNQRAMSVDRERKLARAAPDGGGK